MTSFDEAQHNDYIEIRWKVGDREFQAKGPHNRVETYLAVFLSTAEQSNALEPMVGNIVISPEALVQISPETDTPPLADGGAQSETIEAIVDNNSNPPNDLVELYHKLSPDGQYEQIVVITYFYEKVKGKTPVTYPDYDQGYEALKRLKVDKPTNVKGSVRNAQNRTVWLYSPNPGEFSLTIQGEQWINERLAGKSETQK